MGLFSIQGRALQAAIIVNAAILILKRLDIPTGSSKATIRVSPIQTAIGVEIIGGKIDAVKKFGMLGPYISNIAAGVLAITIKVGTHP